MDVLADLLERARARGAAFALSTLHAPWGMQLTDASPLSVHVVLRGEAWLVHADDEPERLLQGDVALVASGREYRLLSEPGAECHTMEDLSGFAVPGSPGVFHMDGDGPATVLLCGAYRFHGDLCERLLEALPPTLVIRSGEGTPAPAVRATIGLLADEIVGDGAGRTTVLDRLLDVLLVLVLRAWFDQPQARAPRWYAAMSDPEVGRALRMVHAAPEQRWTVESLASAVGLSRAAFARRFAALVGSPPLSYVSEWRMALAAEQLRDSDLSIARVARSVGYDNEFAFSTAFRRQHGTSPSAYRSAARGRQLTASSG